ncbi:MAG: hypothetical protein KKI16_07875, partial [Alphaproteobacteria bacterium]|nr:hypothetical protein [Alphaproteobacteria bacterium]
AVANVLAAGPDGDLNPVAARQAWPVGPGNPPYNAFAAEEVALSRAFYAAQVDEIAAMDGVDLLRQ